MSQKIAFLLDYAKSDEKFLNITGQWPYPIASYLSALNLALSIFAVNSQVNAFNGGWMEELSEANLIRVLGVGTAFILLIIVIVGLDFEVSTGKNQTENKAIK